MFELLLFFAFSPNTQLEIATSLSRNNQYEQSENILKSFRARDTKQETYMFYRFLNNFKMNNKKEAEKYADYLQGIEVTLPERYQVLTYLMKQDMAQWKSDNIEDIARDMSHAKDRIENKDLGNSTQKIQKDIITKLDKLIKENEDKANGKGDTSQPSASNKATQPLPDSKIVGSEGIGTVDNTKFKKFTENWGTLPPRERVLALQELTQGMSPRHREAIENYFRNLATLQSNKK